MAKRSNRSKKGPSASKAKKILKDGEVYGEPLTDRQRRFFASIAYGDDQNNKAKGGEYKGGGKYEYQEGGELSKAVKEYKKYQDPATVSKVPDDQIVEDPILTKKRSEMTKDEADLYDRFTKGDPDALQQMQERQRRLANRDNFTQFQQGGEISDAMADYERFQTPLTVPKYDQETSLQNASPEESDQYMEIQQRAQAGDPQAQRELEDINSRIQNRQNFTQFQQGGQVEGISNAAADYQRFQTPITVPKYTQEEAFQNVAQEDQELMDLQQRAQAGDPQAQQELQRVQERLQNRQNTTQFKEGGYYAVKKSETESGEPKYPINSADDVRDAWKLRNHGDYKISKETLEQRIKNKAQEYGVDLNDDNKDEKENGGPMEYQAGGSIHRGNSAGTGGGGGMSAGGASGGGSGMNAGSIMQGVGGLSSIMGMFGNNENKGGDERSKKKKEEEQIDQGVQAGMSAINPLLGQLYGLSSGAADMIYKEGKTAGRQGEDGRETKAESMSRTALTRGLDPVGTDVQYRQDHGTLEGTGRSVTETSTLGAVNPGDVFNDNPNKTFDANIFEKGGRMEVTEYNEGGRHEDTQGGVDLGSKNAEVEEGETALDGEFAYSDRLKLNKQLAKKVGLPEDLAGQTFADASKEIENKYKKNRDTSSDPYTNNALERELNRLKEANQIKIDRQKQEEEQEPQEGPQPPSQSSPQEMAQRPQEPTQRPQRGSQGQQAQRAPEALKRMLAQQNQAQGPQRAPQRQRQMGGDLDPTMDTIDIGAPDNEMTGTGTDNAGWEGYLTKTQGEVLALGGQQEGDGTTSEPMDTGPSVDQGSNRADYIYDMGEEERKRYLQQVSNNGQEPLPPDIQQAMRKHRESPEFYEDESTPDTSQDAQNTSQQDDGFWYDKIGNSAFTGADAVKAGASAMNYMGYLDNQPPEPIPEDRYRMESNMDFRPIDREASRQKLQRSYERGEQALRSAAQTPGQYLSNRAQLSSDEALDRAIAELKMDSAEDQRRRQIEQQEDRIMQRNMRMKRMLDRMNTRAATQYQTQQDQARSAFLGDVSGFATQGERREMTEDMAEERRAQMKWSPYIGGSRKQGGS